MARKTGHTETTSIAGEKVSAFIPAPLPPANPPLQWSGVLQERLRSAETALRRLEVAGEIVPSMEWFVYAFVRKEAVLSSQIEGTQATLVDLFRFETGDRADSGKDVAEVCNYLNALAYARKQLGSAKGLPLSMRLLHEAHRRLMRGGRGVTKQPGEIRRTQNWIGGSRPGNAVFVPPPPHHLENLLSQFEKFMNGKDREISTLVRAGLLHVQFESIHPYLDGNGRIGRLLVSLLLEKEGALTQPLLYLSLHFKRHREEYYRRLNAVRTDGDWEGWLDFFLDGIATIAEEAIASARELFAIVAKDRERVLAARGASIAAIRLFERLPQRPIVTASAVMKLLNVSKPTAGRAIDLLVDAGILEETTGKRRDRWFAYERYVSRLRVETDRSAS